MEIVLKPPFELPVHRFSGTLVVVCGADGSGKSTIIEALKQACLENGKNVTVTKQPTSTIRNHPLFKRFIYSPDERRSIDYRALVCLITSDRLQHLKDVIDPALMRGDVVICDRYIYTAMAEFRARGYVSELWFELLSTQFPRPDFSFLLNAPIEILVQRIRSRIGDRESFVEIDHLQQVCTHYLDVAREHKLHVIDTTDSNINRALSDITKIFKVCKCS